MAMPDLHAPISNVVNLDIYQLWSTVFICLLFAINNVAIKVVQSVHPVQRSHFWSWPIVDV